MHYENDCQANLRKENAEMSVQTNAGDFKYGSSTNEAYDRSPSLNKLSNCVSRSTETLNDPADTTFVYRHPQEDDKVLANKFMRAINRIELNSHFVTSSSSSSTSSSPLSPLSPLQFNKSDSSFVYENLDQGSLIKLNRTKAAKPNHLALYSSSLPLSSQPLQAISELPSGDSIKLVSKPKKVLMYEPDLKLNLAKNNLNSDNVS